MNAYDAQIQQATIFAAECTELIRLVSPESVPLKFDVLEASKGLRISTITPQEPTLLKIGNTQVLSIRVEYTCTASKRHKYLVVETSKFVLSPCFKGKEKEPLLRIEFLRHPDSDIPSSHIQIHAHHEAWSYAMLLQGRTSPRQSVNKRKGIPSISQLHIPTGGARMRPTLEDFIQFLICELGVDCVEGALKALEEHRAQWRKRQLESMVSRSPEIAADVLRRHGWSVDPPPDFTSREEPSWLTRY